MKSTKHHFTLDAGEYLINGEHQTARDYKVFYKGKELKDVVGLIRINVGEIK